MRLPRIWLITMPEDERGPVEPIARALEGCARGSVGVQLRAKQSSDRQVADWGRRLREVTQRHSSPLLVNGRGDIASIVGADGVHLPERRVDVGTVRGLGAMPWWIGVSCHDRAGLERARDEGADFAFLSPLFEVPNKAPALGIKAFKAAIEGVGIPTYALGGVQPSHVNAVIHAGGAGVALRRPAYTAEPAVTLAGYARELDKHAARGA